MRVYGVARISPVTHLLKHCPIRSKALALSLIQEGTLGNTLRAWTSLQEVFASGYRGTLTLRYAGEAGGGLCRYEVPLAEVATVMRDWTQAGANPDLVRFNESAPDQFLLLQGEVTRLPCGLTLFGSTQPGKMREALRKMGRHLYGLQAKLILEYHLDAASYTDMMDLLDSFPDHVIEFSTYSVDLGQAPHRNTVIWEVRAY